MQSPLHDDVRSSCLNSIHVLSHGFKELTSEHQFIEIMSNPLYYRIASKFMYDILNKRRYMTFHNAIMSNVAIANHLIYILMKN